MSPRRSGYNWTNIFPSLYLADQVANREVRRPIRGERLPVRPAPELPARRRANRHGKVAAPQRPRSAGRPNPPIPVRSATGSASSSTAWPTRRGGPRACSTATSAARSAAPSTARSTAGNPTPWPLAPDLWSSSARLPPTGPRLAPARNSTHARRSPSARP
jgi:hypothetical protein